MAAEVTIRSNTPAEYDVVLSNGHDHVLAGCTTFMEALAAHTACDALLKYLDEQDAPPGQDILTVLREAFQVADQAARAAGEFDQLDEPTDREELAFAHGTADGLRMAVEMLTPVYGA